MKLIRLIVFGIAALAMTLTAAEAGPKWVFVENEFVRIGVDPARGGAVGYFAESATGRNLLNHYDEGRFVQQSYYGDADGSKWNGKPWRYNPIQGGNWQGKRARTLAMKQGAGVLSVRTEPVNWAGGEPCPEMSMSQQIRLEGAVAIIRYEMRYAGETHKARHQEMPAMFVDAALKQLAFVRQGELVKRTPGHNNESGRTDEEWVAYVNTKDFGIGILTPGTTEFTSYRRIGDGKMGESGSACSYVAPIRTLALTKGMTVSYDVYLTIGTLSEIRKRFAGIRAGLAKAAGED